MAQEPAGPLHSFMANGTVYRRVCLRETGKGRGVGVGRWMGEEGECYRSTCLATVSQMSMGGGVTSPLSTDP